MKKQFTSSNHLNFINNLNHNPFHCLQTITTETYRLEKNADAWKGYDGDGENAGDEDDKGPSEEDVRRKSRRELGYQVNVIL